MLSRQIEPEASLHGRDELHPWPERDRALDQAQVREVVLDIEQRAGLLHGDGEAHGLGRDPLRPFDGALGLRELDPERAALAWHALDADRAAHGLDEPLG